jgi:hypothetical protein
MKSRCGIAAIAIVGALAAAGCGSSSSSTTSTQAALTKKEFLAKGNAICKEGNQAINKAAHQTFGKQKPSKSQVQAFVTKTVIPSVQQQITGIKNLPQPAGDEAQVTKIVDDAQAALDKAKQNPTLLTQKGPGPFKQVNKETKAYGLTACS